MFKDKITLISSDLINEKKIYANIYTTSRNEFYQSTQMGLNATIEARIRSNSYNDEKFATVKGKDFFIIRTVEKEDDFMHLVLVESDLKTEISLIKEKNVKQADGTYEKEELSREEVMANVRYTTARYQDSQNSVKTRTIRQAIVKIRYVDGIDLDNVIEISGKKWYIISENNLYNLSCWTELTLEEVV